MMPTNEGQHNHGSSTSDGTHDVPRQERDDRASGAGSHASVEVVARGEKGALDDAETSFFSKFRSNKRNLRLRQLQKVSDLGSLLLQAKVISSEDLRRALEFQTSHPKKLLGECLVDLGMLPHEAIDAFLLQQKAVRTGKAADVIRLAMAVAQHA